MNNYRTLVFTIDDINVNIIFSPDNQTAWLTKKDIAILFNKSRSTISRYVIEALKSFEHNKDSFAHFLHISTDLAASSNHRPPEYYDLEIIQFIGQKIKSDKGDVLKQFIDNYIQREPFKDKQNVIKYNNGNISLDVNISPEEETVWLSQSQISTLFNTTQQNISLHIRNIIREGELELNTTHKFFLYDVGDGRKYNVEFFNLDMILSIGYRVNSKEAIQFRRWASNILKQYLFKGYAIDSERIITARNIIELENDVSEIKKEIADIKERTFIEPIKEKLFFQGEYFDAYDFLCSIVASAEKNILIIDPYFDEKGLAILSKANNNCQIKVILSSRAGVSKSDVDNFTKQYIHIDMETNDTFHDRFIMVDRKTCYDLGASLNYAGKRTFGVYQINTTSIINYLLSLF